MLESDDESFIGTLEDEGLASYDPQITTLATGAVNAGAKVLYDSHEHKLQLIGGFTGGGAPSFSAMNNAARAEARSPVVYAVEGVIICEPSSWTIGTAMVLGMRLGIFTQDMFSGQLSVEGNYSMWVNPSNVTPLDNCAQWANDKRILREWRIRKAQSDGATAPNMVIPIRWRSRMGRKLLPDQCLALYMESPAYFDSVNIRMQAWLRTLVADET